MDIKLNYVEAGSGAPLILLHGNGESHECFAAQIPYFAAHYRVIAVDTRGHGDSPRGSAPFTIRQFALDLHDFMDELGLEKAHILGFSDGGNIALAFALQWPERVDRLILNGANLFPAGVRARYQIPITLRYRATRVLAAGDAAAMHRMELLRLMVNEPDFTFEELETLDVPTLVIAGTDDMIRMDHTCKIASHLPRSALAFIYGDHFIAQKEPEAFNQAVGEFLNA